MYFHHEVVELKLGTTLGEKVEAARDRMPDLVLFIKGDESEAVLVGLVMTKRSKEIFQKMLQAYI